MTSRGAARQRLRRALRRIRLGSLHRTTPLSDAWGFDRGTPIDRHYIEAFLGAHAADVRGRVLEVQDRLYTDRFGSGLTRRDVLDVDPGNRRATLVGDLATGEGLPAGAYDCFVLTQTLHLIFDLQPAVANARRLLAPGGVLLATLPSVSRISGSAADLDCWRLTPTAAHRLFAETFGEDAVQVEAYGNVLAGVAFLTGMAAEELAPDELAAHDPRFPVLVGVRAEKR